MNTTDVQPDDYFRALALVERKVKEPDSSGIQTSNTESMADTNAALIHLMAVLVSSTDVPFDQVIERLGSVVLKSFDDKSNADKDNS